MADKDDIMLLLLAENVVPAVAPPSPAVASTSQRPSWAGAQLELGQQPQGQQVQGAEKSRRPSKPHGAEFKVGALVHLVDLNALHQYEGHAGTIVQCLPHDKFKVRMQIDGIMMLVLSENTPRASFCCVFGYFAFVYSLCCLHHDVISVV